MVFISLLSFVVFLKEHDFQLFKLPLTPFYFRKRGVILRGWANLSLDLLDPEEDAEYISYAKAGNIMFLGF